MTITYTIGNTLYLNITNRCSNSCEFCIRNNGAGVGDAANLWLEHEPSRGEILDDLARRDLSAYDEVVFCGYGEPTERFDDLLSLCKAIRERAPGVKIRINTNGQADLISGRSTAPELKGLVDAVSISLNAPNAEEYQKLCHSVYGESAYDAILRYAADCKKVVPEVVLSVVDVLSEEDIARCRAMAEQVGVQFRARVKID